MWRWKLGHFYLQAGTSSFQPKSENMVLSLSEFICHSIHSVFWASLLFCLSSLSFMCQWLFWAVHDTACLLMRFFEHLNLFQNVLCIVPKYRNTVDLRLDNWVEKMEVSFCSLVQPFFMSSLCLRSASSWYLCYNAQDILFGALILQWC